MFEKLKKSAELEIKKRGLNTNSYLLDKKDTYSKGYWYGYIKGIESAEKQIKESR